MAVALRSSSDLVYLPDHGFVGEDGALRILVHVNRHIRRIDVSHNLLGPDGTAVLMAALNILRSKTSTPDLLWGLREISLANNGLDDAALDHILTYAKKDVCLAKVMLQGNEIELRLNVDLVAHTINSSRLSVLSLNNNTSLSNASLSQLFDKLCPAHLSELHLSACAIDSTVAPHIASFLASPRSRLLETLGLKGNRLSARGVKAIVDAVENHNYTVTDLGLLANDVDGQDPSLVAQGQDTESHTRSEDEKTLDASVLYYNIHERLPLLLERNRRLTRRTRNAALRAIAPARIILNAQPLSDLETARRAIEDVNGGNSVGHFRLFELPRELVYTVVRHMSFDYGALTSAQFTRLVKEAENRDSIAKLKRQADDRVRRAPWQEGERVKWELKEDWLKKGGWDRWEVESK